MLGRFAQALAGRKKTAHRSESTPLPTQPGVPTSSAYHPKPGLKIYVVRHGHSEGNAQRILQGHKDYVLSPEGRRQAYELSELFGAVKFNKVYSSDLKRAYDTAQILTQEQYDITPHKLLRERTFGQFEGRSIQSFLDHFRDQMAERDRLHHHQRFYHKLHPEIESDAEVFHRMNTALGQIQSEVKTGNVLVVSHGGAMRALLVHLGFLPPDQFRYDRIKNLGYFVFEPGPGELGRILHHDGV